MALKGNGDVLAAGPYLLKVPGAKGTLRLEISGLEAEGASLRGEARLRNDCGLLLAGLTLDFESASATRTNPSVPGAPPTSTPSPAPLSLREPLDFGDLLGGEATPWVPFELSPIPVGEDVALATFLGTVRGLAVEPAVTIAGAARPVALDVDRYGRLYVATGGVGRVLRLTAASAADPSEVARPSSPPTGVALRRRNGDLFVATGGRIIEIHRPGVTRVSTLDAGRPVTLLRIDGKDVLRAAAGGSVLAFDETKPEPARPLGPDGAAVVSFDTDARGVVHAVVAGGGSSRLVVSTATGPAPFAARRGTGSDAVDAPAACRFDGEGTLWVGATPRTAEGTVLARFLPDGTPLAALSRLALGLLLGKEEEVALPSVVDLARGAEGRLWALLEDGSVFEIRAF